MLKKEVFAIFKFPYFLSEIAKIHAKIDSEEENVLEQLYGRKEGSDNQELRNYQQMNPILYSGEDRNEIIDEYRIKKAELQPISENMKELNAGSGVERRAEIEKTEKFDKNEKEEEIKLKVDEGGEGEGEEVLSDVMKKINVVFAYYASYGDRLNINYLKSAKFHKMMEDAKIEDKLSMRKRLDLIFCAENKHKANMVFDTFLDCLPKIAQVKYPFIYQKESPSKALDYLIHQNILSLYQIILKNSSVSQLQDISRLDTQYCELIHELIKNLHPILFVVFSAYFPWEIKSKENAQILSARSEKSLFPFLKEFDISPSLLNKSKSFQIYQHTLKSNPQSLKSLSKSFHIGTGLSFPHFLDFLMNLSEFTFTLTQSLTGPRKIPFFS